LEIPQDLCGEAFAAQPSRQSCCGSVCILRIVWFSVCLARLLPGAFRLSALWPSWLSFVFRWASGKPRRPRLSSKPLLFFTGSVGTRATPRYWLRAGWHLRVPSLLQCSASVAVVACLLFQWCWVAFGVVVVVCIYIFRERSSQFAFIYCSSHACAFIYFAGVRRSLHLYIALRMLVHFYISLAFVAVCISILLFACLFFIVLLMVASVVLFSCVLWISYFRLFVVFFCCCSLRSILAAARLQKAWAVDYAAMHDVPNGVFLPWKSQRAYSTGYSWYSGTHRGCFLLDFKLGALLFHFLVHLVFQ
jgi:hypothetical protein